MSDPERQSPHLLQPFSDKLVLYYCRDPYHNKICVQPKKLKNHQSREPIYRDDILFKYLWMAISMPDDLIVNEVHYTKRTNKDGVVFEYRKENLLRELGLPCPKGLVDLLAVQVLFPNEYDDHGQDPENVDGFTLTYYLRNSYV